MLVRLTVTLLATQWCLIFAGSLFHGCDAGLGLAKATASTLGTLAGWLAYLGIIRPLRQPGTAYETLGTGWIFLGIPSVHLMRPTREPWPFPEMLVHAIIPSVFSMMIIALVYTKFIKRLVKPGPGDRSGTIPTSRPSTGE